MCVYVCMCACVCVCVCSPPQHRGARETRQHPLQRNKYKGHTPSSNSYHRAHNGLLSDSVASLTAKHVQQWAVIASLLIWYSCVRQ